MADERKAVHAYLSDDAHAAWAAFAEDNGCSVTGLIEALGRELLDEIADHGGDATEVRQSWVKRGRRIDADRRKR